LTIDIFLIYAADDEKIAADIRLMFTKCKRKLSKKDIKIVVLADILKKASTWKHDVITAMLSSYRFD